MQKQILKYKQMSREELAKFLCLLVDDTIYDSDAGKCCCDCCPAQDDCRINHCGFLDWLDDEDV